MSTVCVHTNHVAEGVWSSLPLPLPKTVLYTAKGGPNLGFEKKRGGSSMVNCEAQKGKGVRLPLNTALQDA